MKITTIAVTLAALSLGACVKEQVIGGGGPNVGPSLVLEQFMRAVNKKDLTSMARLFGTKDGPISERDSRTEVEPRMFTLATILNHDDYEIVNEQQVPGRAGVATQLIVRMKAGSLDNRVPFTFVRWKETWLIEQIGIDAITRQR
jgi:hypothetical protein